MLESSSGRPSASSRLLPAQVYLPPRRTGSYCGQAPRTAVLGMTSTSMYTTGTAVWDRVVYRAGGVPGGYRAGVVQGSEAQESPRIAKMTRIVKIAKKRQNGHFVTFVTFTHFCPIPGAQRRLLLEAEGDLSGLRTTRGRSESGPESPAGSLESGPESPAGSLESDQNDHGKPGIGPEGPL